MKNILLLGNGFDLYYKLPTKYADFLHVVSFLQSNHNTTFDTIGDVFSQQTLQISDPFIKTCYETHQKSYDITVLDPSNVNEILRLTTKNPWFLYLKKVFNKDVGWIDFEKEISFVLKCFETAFDKAPVLHFKSNEQYVKYVINLFEFFIDHIASQNSPLMSGYRVHADYCIEKPLGSKNKIINTEKVVDKLYKELFNLSEALKLYLQCFVENIYVHLKNNNTYNRINFFSHIEKTITFNYTNTYEELYFNRSAFHIHGNINKEIVLGINPNTSDKLESIDTTFVCFKKYFQRTLFETDIEYLRWLNEATETKLPYRLFVMGHSLDITDQDIIVELFQNAKEIMVLYHNLDAKKSYIENLIKLFGKVGFDSLRRDKKLVFVSLTQDFSTLKKSLSDEMWNDLFISLDIEKDDKIIPV